MTGTKIFAENVKNPKKVYSFDDAMAMTGYGKFNYLISLLCGIISLALVFETGGYSFIILGSQCDLSLSSVEKGLLGGIPLTGLLASSQIWGYLADTKGRRKILMQSMFLGSIVSILSSFSPNFMTLIISKFISSALVSATNAVLFTYAGEMSPKSHGDMMLSFLSAVFVGGSIITTGISWGILVLDFNIPLAFLDITFRPWRLLIICFAFPFLLMSAAMYYAPESPKFLMTLKKNDEVLEILRKIYKTNSGKDPSTYPVERVVIDKQDDIDFTHENKSILGSIWSQLTPIFKPPLIVYSIILFVLSYGIVANINPFTMWLPDMVDRFYAALNRGHADDKTFCDILIYNEDRIYENYNHTSSDAVKGIEVCDDSFQPGSYPFMLIINGILTLVNISVVVMLKWVSKKTILICSMVICSISVLALVFVRNYMVAWLLIILYQFVRSVGGIPPAYVVELFPTQYRAMASSFVLMFGRIGAIINTNLHGVFLEIDCSLNFYLSFVQLLLCVIVSIFLPKTKKKKTETENPP